MPTRRRYHHGDLPRALIDAALELIAEAGADTFTLREAARRVGVNHRAVYRHFADKESLLATIAIEGLRGLVGEVEGDLAALSGATPRQRLLAVVRAYLRYAVSHPAHYRVTFGPRLNAEGRFPALEAAMSRAVAVVSRELGAGQVGGAPVFDDMMSLWAGMHGLAQLVLMRRIAVKPSLLEDYAAARLAPLIDGLLTARGGALMSPVETSDDPSSRPRKRRPPAGH